MIYFHIPFCKQACHYCDFHFSTSLKYKAEMLEALSEEVMLRSSYLPDNVVHSIYFGGGTPSILEADDIQRLIDRVAMHFEIAPDAEITLEANPDDLNTQKVAALRHTAINRFSIGIQSFFEEDLRWMNRAHHAQEAEASLKRVQDAGFENITCDLIYGFPLLTDEKWQANIAMLTTNQISHISSYAMTVEERTALDYMIRKGKTAPLNEEQSATQFEILMEILLEKGYEHYEISNFSLPGMYAKHNTNYWRGQHYLGIGPSAHSFNGHSRSWNIANNMRYIEDIQRGQPPLQSETLSSTDQVNEYVMTSLRTMWGMDLDVIEKRFGLEIRQRIEEEVLPFIHAAEVIRIGNSIRLTTKGKLLADHIASSLFLTE